MDLNSILLIIIGMLLKFVDDYYDMDIFNDIVGNLAQGALFIISIMLFMRNKIYPIIALIICLMICIAAPSQMNLYYYYGYMAITAIFAAYYITKYGILDIFKDITMTDFIIILYGIIFIYYEDKLIPEEISNRKILSRIFIMLASLFYIWYEETYNEKMIFPHVAATTGLGYMSISLINLCYTMLKTKSLGGKT